MTIFFPQTVIIWAKIKKKMAIIARKWVEWDPYCAISVKAAFSCYNA